MSDDKPSPQVIYLNIIAENWSPTEEEIVEIARLFKKAMIDDKNPDVRVAVTVATGDSSDQQQYLLIGQRGSKTEGIVWPAGDESCFVPCADKYSGA